ncbi:MAG: hypothetical protein IJF15_06955 [Oscillospiraceae bacterium]|nr:hypothetical protein [Oscillospiraceae bacterium]
MINTLFSMHNIKYIISVDDCFFALKREDMEAVVYSEMCNSLDPFRALLSSCGQTAYVDEIDEMLSMGVESSALVHSLLDRLEDAELLKCYEICEQNGITYTEERDGIIAFLEGLKSGGQITEYLTFPSTLEANEFDVQAAGMTDGGILWLLDRNFLRAGESADAGLALAENLVQKTDGVSRYIYVLSAVDADSQQSEDEIELEFDRVLAEKCSAETHSFIYYINKQRILKNKTDRIAKSLAQGFKRKACYELLQLFSDCLSDGLTDASTKIQYVRQKTLNSLFFNKVQKNGESYTDFAGRFVQIFHYDGYNRAIAQKYNAIATKAKYYESLCSVIVDNDGNSKELTDVLKEYREIELFNKHINSQHCEVATGDIFEIAGSFYLLVSQSCDTYLRKNGERKLTEATLLEISDDGKKREYSYCLSCFNTMSKPTVVYHSLKILPFDILDLCTFNASGQATICIKDPAEFKKELELYTVNYQARFYKVLERIAQIHSNRTLLQKFWDDPSSVSSEDACKAYVKLDKIDPNLKEYDAFDTIVSFPVKRICRLNELTTIDIIKEYGVMLSRIGHPFDFVSDSH